MKTFIIIPALEPEPGLEQRVRELQEALPSQVIVIDDGSGAGYKEIFEAADRIRGCTVLRHGTNRGKGCALKTGFAYIKGKADQMQIVCADCDGQHLPADCARLAARSAECPGSLVLGVRDFSGDHVPWRSRVGNRISSRILEKAAGIRLSDTQTGLRAFDGSLLDIMCSIPGNRFEYETEVLLACAQRGVPVVAEPVETVYVDSNEGSHFRPVRDSIYVMSVFLKRPVKFMLSSAFCALLDLALFAAAFRLTGSVFAATGAARILSAAANYCINRAAVFRSSRKSIGVSAVRYGVLCVGIAVLSALSVSALSAVLRIRPEAAKIFCDAVLFFISYRVQKRWVFR